MPVLCIGANEVRGRKREVRRTPLVKEDAIKIERAAFIRSMMHLCSFKSKFRRYHLVSQRDRCITYYEDIELRKVESQQQHSKNVFV